MTSRGCERRSGRRVIPPDDLPTTGGDALAGSRQWRTCAGRYEDTKEGEPMRTLRFASILAGTTVALAAAGLALWTDQTQAQRSRVKTTKYEVDGAWPKPFPSTPDPVTGRPRTWIPGEVAGTCVDSRDNVFIVTRGNLLDNEVTKGTPAPPVIEFDPDGNIVAGWGNRGVLPNGIHGCFVDYQDNIWIGGNGDGIVQKYSRAGTLLLQIGTRGVCDNPPANNCGNSGANA